jgi:hypothetical protein
MFCLFTSAHSSIHALHSPIWPPAVWIPIPTSDAVSGQWGDRGCVSNTVNIEDPTKSEPKVMQFAAMTPHLLLLDHSMSSICNRQVMFCCKTSSWWHWWSISAKPGHFFGQLLAKVSICIQPNLSQSSCGVQPWHLICCCWTIPCPPYVTNEWCFCCEMSSWWPISAKPSHFFGQLLPKVSISIQPNLNLSQSSCGVQPWHLICCCWTIPCPPYVTNEWCFVVKWGPGGPSLPSQVTFLSRCCQKFRSIQSNLSQKSCSL